MLTFEELAKLSSCIEAVLNSLPLTPLSSDPNNLRALSPGDFPVGKPLTDIFEPDLTLVLLNRLNRWQLLQQMYLPIILV